MRFHQLRGQTTVEFAFAGIWLILLMMAVLCFGFITFQKSSFDYQVSHMADELPSGWESMDAKRVVKSCVAAASGLSEDDIEVNSAGSISRTRAAPTSATAPQCSSEAS